MLRAPNREDSNKEIFPLVGGQIEFVADGEKVVDCGAVGLGEPSL